MLSLNKMIGFALAIAVFFFIVLGLLSPGEGLFPKTAKAVIDALDFDLGIGLEENLAESVSISSEHKKELGSLQYTIKLLMEESTPENSFDYWGGFSSLEKEMKIEMNQGPKGVNFVIKGGAGGKQDYERFHIEGMQLCVIGGNQKVTENFDHNFLAINNQEMKEPYYKEVEQIIIQFDKTRKNQNRIDYGQGLVNFAGDEWLFRPKEGIICFFPTVIGNAVCDGSKAIGLDDDCFEENDRRSIPKRYNQEWLNNPAREAEEVVEAEEEIIREKVLP